MSGNSPWGLDGINDVGEETDLNLVDKVFMALTIFGASTYQGLRFDKESIPWPE